MTREVDLFNLSSTYVVLDQEGDTIPIAVGDRFYQDLECKFGDFQGKRLVSHHSFEKDWDSWEMHPAGNEFVLGLTH